MYNIKISGIYATALTLLLMEQGFKVSRLDQSPHSRGTVDASDTQADVKINDRWNKQGIVCAGEPDAFHKLLECLLEEFPGIVVHHSLAGSRSVYKARVKKTNFLKGYSVVDLGTAAAVLIGETYPEDTEVLVEIREPDYGDRKARGTSNVTVSSPYAVIFQGENVKISRKIRDETRRLHLLKLGKDVKPDGFTILWRTAASSAPDDFLAADIHQLTKKASRIFNRAQEVKAPAILWEGEKAADFEFPAFIKHTLDKLRRQVTPTVLDHHMLKSSGDTFALGVDLAEKLMRTENTEIQNILHQLVNMYYPGSGAVVEIEHVKLNGHIVKLGPGRVIETSNNNTVYIMRRDIRGRGVYDGFNAKRVFGDYVFTRARVEDWFTTSHYYSQTDQLKGIYININTPVERYPWGIHYIDLGVDVVQRPNGEVEIIDLDELDEAIDEHYITEWMRKKALEVAEEHKQKLIATPLPEPMFLHADSVDGID